jgi:hypothetical protein
MHQHLERLLARATAQYQTKTIGNEGNGIHNRLVRAAPRQTTKATNS